MAQGAIERIVTQERRRARTLLSDKLVDTMHSDIDRRATDLHSESDADSLIWGTQIQVGPDWKKKIWSEALGGC